jgi:WD repeat-containing protein 49
MNNIFQVVSASENGVVTIWMVDTSQKVKQWTDAHGSAKLTAITQDYNETKILTGATDGIVKVFVPNCQWSKLVSYDCGLLPGDSL